MSKANRLTPFGDNFDDSIGRGKDNVVAPFKERSDIVVKWNHDTREALSSDEHFNRTLYKKKKYEMLSFFLGDFIPESWFVLGNKQDGDKVKIKEYTLQRRVPQVTISSLSEEQKDDPRLLHNMHLLIQKLQNMYKILGQVNRLIDSGQLDAKLDLGGLSKYAEQHSEDEDEDFDFSVINYDFMSSPNLLVDPETMQLFCIDFDQGEWSSEKEASLHLVKMIANSNAAAKALLQKAQRS